MEICHAHDQDRVDNQLSHDESVEKYVMMIGLRFFKSKGLNILAKKNPQSSRKQII